MNLLIGVHDEKVKDKREERERVRERKGREKKKKKKCQVNYGIHEQPRKKKRGTNEKDVFHQTK